MIGAPAGSAGPHRFGAVPAAPAALLACIPLLLWTLPLSAQDAGTAALPTPPAHVRILFFNANNYRPSPDGRFKAKDSMQAVADTLRDLRPDIAILAEIADTEALADLLERMGEDASSSYTYRHLVEASDTSRRLAVLARREPLDQKHDTEASYTIKDTRVPVRRGFAHCVFGWNNGYRLHVLGAHLKSKVYHHLGQTDMRRYEARQLRYRVNDILEANPEANVLVLGDMNDSPQSSPIKTIIYRRFGTEKELFDLRPADERQMLWTHYWDEEDLYARIDYAFATYHLLPEIVFDETVVADLPYWRTASDHRPVLVTLKPENAEPSRHIMDMFYRNFRSHPFREHRDADGPIAPQAR